MKLSYIIGAAALCLTACADPEISQPPIPVTPKFPNSANGLDVFAAARASNPRVPAYQGPTRMTVRTRATGDDNRSGPFAGARCTLDNEYYSASFTTPAIIELPNYKQTSPDVTISCTDGTRSATRTAEIINLSARDRQTSAGATGGLIGSLVGAGLNAAMGDLENDTWGYGNVSLFLRPQRQGQ